MSEAKERSTTFEITRRGFIAGLSAATAGLALGVRAVDAAPAATGFAPNPFVQIGTDGVVTIICARAEMGQGVRSSLPVLIADELGANPATIRIVQGDGDAKYGDQNTDGSTSVRKLYTQMREMGATARMMLVGAAAKQWGVPAQRLIAKDDAVHDPSTKRKLAFGQLVVAAAKLPVPKKPVLRPMAEMPHVGKELPLRDGPAYVTGQAQFGADISLPGMLIAVIARPPVVFGDVAKLDDAKAKAIPGVKHVIKLPPATPPALSKPLGGVAVVATNTWAALRGRAALDITWSPGAHGDHDSDAHARAMSAAVRASGRVARQVGDAEAALASAAKRVEAEYSVPQLAHASMEPPAALARVTADGAEIWTCTQDPQNAQNAIAMALGLDKSKVTVHMTFLGGGFGRKSIPDYAVEAALLAKQLGVPVRVQWTREDDLRHDYYHAPSVQLLTAGLDASNKVVAWRHRCSYPSIGWTFDGKADRPGDGELSLGVLDLPLAIPNVRVESCPAPAHARIGWLRSVANIQQAFAVQSFIDELAHTLKRDPKDVLLEVIGSSRDVITPQTLGVPKLGNYGTPLEKHPISRDRFHAVIEAVAKASRWNERHKQTGRGYGLAVHRSFLSYIGVVVAVTKDTAGRPRLDEVWVAADCGTIINAERVRSQLEGAVIFGQSIAFHSEITMKAGAVVQRNFHDHKLARMNGAPRAIHIELLPSSAPPGGVGEPGVPPVAPAIANAVFALTGIRHRRLPMPMGT